MKTALYALTEGGTRTALKIAACMPAVLFLRKPPRQATASYHQIDQPIKQLLADNFHDYDCHIFIMATGIVVRSLVGLLKSKTTDPAVLVVDEKANFVISLLSGHLGGANQYAVRLAAQLAAQPVITTSTDLNQTIAFDIVAKKNRLVIANIDVLKHISQAMIHKLPVHLFSAVRLKGRWPANLKLVKRPEMLTESSHSVIISARKWQPITHHWQLHLIAKHLVVGIGCRRGVACQQIEEALDRVLVEYNFDKRAIARISSVDVKSDEVGLIQLSQKHHWPLDIISRRQIAEVEDLFEGSTFVKETIGVAAVAEPCAYISSRSGKKVSGKFKYNGVTIAIYQEAFTVTLQETDDELASQKGNYE